MSEVPAFRPEAHERHAPRQDLSDGLPPVAHPEVPARLSAIEAGLGDALALSTTGVTQRATAAVRRLHDGDYVDCLLAFEPEIGPTAELIPSVFHADLSRAPLRFRLGMFCTEIGTPMQADTVDAALRAARCAEEAALAVRDAGSPLAVALCRPPGHHAGRRRYGGYCYFNNAYVAAEVLSRGGGTAAVLDLDYHLGDGSAELASASRPYFSLHADPWRNYPYLDAVDHPHGASVDLTVLPEAVDGPGYRRRLAPVLQRLAASGAKALVVSLGFDALGGDPVQDAPMALRTADYEAIGRDVAALGLPTVVVVEGGYDVASLRACAAAFGRGINAS